MITPVEHDPVTGRRDKSRRLKTLLPPLGCCLSLLDKMEASGLIEELFDTHGGKGQGNAKRGNSSAYSGTQGRRPP